MAPLRILFVCTHRGGRSRVAELFARQLGGGRLVTRSASFEEGPLGDLPARVMRELGIELPLHPGRTVFQRHEDGESYDWVISLCDEAGSKECPEFQRRVDGVYDEKAQRESWSIRDFSTLEGVEEVKLEKARAVRDEIREQVVALLERVGVLASRS